MIAWSVGDLAKTLGIPKENVRLVSPFVGGGFGGKLFVRADAVLAALGRAGGRAAREGGAAAAADDEQHDAPAGDHPAHPHRRHPRRQDHRDRPRGLVRRPAGRLGRDGGQPDAAAVRRRQSPDHHAAGGAGPARGQRDARARRGARHDGAGDRHGRDGGEAGHRPGGVPHRQRHAGRPGEAGPPLLAAPARAVPAHGCRALRLEPAQRPTGARCATAAGSSAWAWPRPSATTC